MVLCPQSSLKSPAFCEMWPIINWVKGIKLCSVSAFRLKSNSTLEQRANIEERLKCWILKLNVMKPHKWMNFWIRPPSVAHTHTHTHTHTMFGRFSSVTSLACLCVTGQKQLQVLRCQWLDNACALEFEPFKLKGW